MTITGYMELGRKASNMGCEGFNAAIIYIYIYNMRILLLARMKQTLAAGGVIVA